MSYKETHNILFPLSQHSSVHEVHLEQDFHTYGQLYESTDLCRLLSASPAFPGDCTCLDTENISKLAIPAFGGGVFRANYLLRAVNYLLRAEQAICGFPSAKTKRWLCLSWMFRGDDARSRSGPRVHWRIPSPGRTGHGGCGDGGSGTGALPALQRPPPRRGPAAPRSLPARPAAGSPAGEAGRSLFPAGGRATMARGRKPGGGRAGTQDAGPGEGREREEGW